MINWWKELYESIKRSNDEKPKFYAKYKKEMKKFPANIDVYIKSNNVYRFIMPLSIVFNECIANSLDDALNEIKETVLNEFPNLYDDAHFTIYDQRFGFGIII